MSMSEADDCVVGAPAVIARLARKRPARKSKNAASAKIKAQSAVLNDDDSMHKLLREGERIVEKKKREEKRNPSRKTKSSSYNPLKSSHLFVDQIGSSSHLIEVLLLHHCNTQHVMLLRAASSFHCRIIDASRSLVQLLYSERHPKFNVSFVGVNHHLAGSMKARVASLGGVTNRSQLPRSVPTMKIFSSSTLSSPVNPADRASLEKRVNLFRAILPRHSRESENPVNLLTVDAASAWMRASEVNDKGLLALSTFKTNQISLKTVHHAGLEFQSDHWRTDGTRRSRARSEYPSTWLCPKDSDSAACLQQLLVRAVEPHRYTYPAERTLYSNVFESVEELRRKLRARVENINTEFKGVLVNILVNDESYVAPTLPSFADIPIYTKIWNPNEAFEALCQVQAPCLDVPADCEIMARHSTFLADIDDSNQSCFDEWLQLQQPHNCFGATASRHMNEPVFPKSPMRYHTGYKRGFVAVNEMRNLCYADTGNALFKNPEQSLSHGCIQLSTGTYNRYDLYPHRHLGYEQLVGVKANGSAVLIRDEGFIQMEKSVIDVSKLIKGRVTFACVQGNLLLLASKSEVRSCEITHSNERLEAKSTGQVFKGNVQQVLMSFDGDWDCGTTIVYLIDENNVLLSAAMSAPEEDAVSVREQRQLEKIKRLLGRQSSERSSMTEFHACDLDGDKAVSVSLGGVGTEAYVLCATESGNLYGWGSPKEGQLGIYSDVYVAMPRLVLGGQKIIKVFASTSNASVAQTADGRLMSTGLRKQGQLGTTKRTGTQHSFAEMDNEAYTSLMAREMIPLAVVIQNRTLHLVYSPKFDDECPVESEDENEIAEADSQLAKHMRCMSELVWHAESMRSGLDKSFFVTKLTELQTSFSLLAPPVAETPKKQQNRAAGTAQKATPQPKASRKLKNTATSKKRSLSAPSRHTKKKKQRK